MKNAFEILQVDAWSDGDGGWAYNDAFHLGEFATSAKDEKAAFLKALHKLGISFRRGTVRVEDDGYYLEIVERKSGRPIFAASPSSF